ncbi:hypothetical protein AKO1_010131, partial [Acrasis kona]
DVTVLVPGLVYISLLIAFVYLFISRWPKQEHGSASYFIKNARFFAIPAWFILALRISEYGLYFLPPVGFEQQKSEFEKLLTTTFQFSLPQALLPIPSYALSFMVTNEVVSTADKLSFFKNMPFSQIMLLSFKILSCIYGVMLLFCCLSTISFVLASSEIWYIPYRVQQSIWMFSSVVFLLVAMWITYCLITKLKKRRGSTLKTEERALSTLLLLSIISSLFNAGIAVMFLFTNMWFMVTILLSLWLSIIFIFSCPLNNLVEISLEQEEGDEQDDQEEELEQEEEQQTDQQASPITYSQVGQLDDDDDHYITPITPSSPSLDTDPLKK